MRRSTAHISPALPLIFAVGLLAGCASPPRPIAYDLAIEPVEGLPVLAVDVIGVTGSELPEWEQMSMSRYWSSGTDENRRREDNIAADFMFTDTLHAGQTDAIILPADDPLWQRWLDRGATHLVVMNNLDADEDRPGSADRRRRILPLARNTWEGDELRVQLRSGGFTVLTRERPRSE